MIGLGRMGANMVRRLQREGHRVVCFDIDPERVAELATLPGV
jgi:6-phosphogluconate dehydrogenase